MKMLVNLLITLCLLSTSAQASDAWFFYDLGGGGTKENYSYTVGGIHPIAGIIKGKVMVGGYVDNTDEAGRKDSLLASYQLGLEVRLFSFLSVGAYSGPGVISQHDTLLGSNLQFVSEAVFRFLSFDDLGLHLGYRHISNADLKMPNEGRDFIIGGLSIGF